MPVRSRIASSAPVTPESNPATPAAASPSTLLQMMFTLQSNWYQRPDSALRQELEAAAAPPTGVTNDVLIQLTMGATGLNAGQATTTSTWAGTGPSVAAAASTSITPTILPFMSLSAAIPLAKIPAPVTQPTSITPAPPLGVRSAVILQPRAEVTQQLMTAAAVPVGGAEEAAA